MRSAFIETLIQLAETDSRVFLITADLGWSVLEPFAVRYPKRYLNVGVAEANMIGIATGLAQLGYIPFVYSIATFSSMRCYEQIRNGPVLHQLPVRIVGIGGGFAYGHAGPTHYALEDIVIMRTQPTMTVLVPSDPPQTRTILRATMNMPGPVYLRIDKGNYGILPELEGRFSLDQPEIIREGTDILLISSGSISNEVLLCADRLRSEGIKPCVALLAHIPNRPSDALQRLVKKFNTVMTVEEGFIAGGLGSCVAEALALQKLAVNFQICGVSNALHEKTGSRPFMLKANGLDSESLATSAKQLLANPSK